MIKNKKNMTTRFNDIVPPSVRAFSINATKITSDDIKTTTGDVIADENGTAPLEDIKVVDLQSDLKSVISSSDGKEQYLSPQPFTITRTWESLGKSGQQTIPRGEKINLEPFTTGTTEKVLIVVEMVMVTIDGNNGHSVQIEKKLLSKEWDKTFPAASSVVVNAVNEGSATVQLNLGADTVDEVSISYINANSNPTGKGTVRFTIDSSVPIRVKSIEYAT